MSDNVIPLRRKEEPEERWASGKARCTACKHECVSVQPVPADTPWMECPACGTHRMLYLGPFVLSEGERYWTCHCGGDLFQVTPDCIFCPGCGVWQSFGTSMGA